MTVREWLNKRASAKAEFETEKANGLIDPAMTFEAWRVTKGYIVTLPEPQ